MDRFRNFPPAPQWASSGYDRRAITPPPEYPSKRALLATPGYSSSPSPFFDTFTRTLMMRTCASTSSALFLLFGAAAVLGAPTSSGTAVARAAYQQAQCPPTDVSGGILLDSGSIGGGLVQCQYETAWKCQYFERLSAPHCLLLHTLDNQLPVRAFRHGRRLPPTDNNGGKLLGSTKDAGGFLTCQYEQAKVCKYFGGNGNFSSGNSVCPANAAPTAIGSAPTVTGSAPASSPSGTNAVCPPTDNNGGKLLSSTGGGKDFLTCQYAQAGVCMYFGGSGSFSSGSSVCPAKADAGSAPPSGSSAVCPPTDNNGGQLLSSTGGGNDFLTCQYEQAGVCTYFGGNGSFSSGSSVCPANAAPTASSSSSSGKLLSAALASADDDSDKDGGISTLNIVLVVINAFLAIALLVVGFLYVRAIRLNRSNKGVYAKVDAQRERERDDVLTPFTMSKEGQVHGHETGRYD
ncbi:hypothetical protein MKEN_00577700 [Mycena kentingensis (nom. inval.)]|nr:hypothetical protein MKEN_00577700 [Mycena kentingensis (nom. inval.)]